MRAVYVGSDQDSSSDAYAGVARPVGAIEVRQVERLAEIFPVRPPGDRPRPTPAAAPSTPWSRPLQRTPAPSVTLVGHLPVQIPKERIGLGVLLVAEHRRRGVGSRDAKDLVDAEHLRHAEHVVVRLVEAAQHPVECRIRVRREPQLELRGLAIVVARGVEQRQLRRRWPRPARRPCRCSGGAIPARGSRRRRRAAHRRDPSPGSGR